MLSARLTINLGKKAKEYVKVVGKGGKYKRGSVSFSEKEGAIVIDVEADDAVALLSSINSAVKQLRIVGEVDSLIE